MGYVQDHLACLSGLSSRVAGGSSAAPDVWRKARPDWRPCAAFDGPVSPGVGRILAQQCLVVDVSPSMSASDVDARRSARLHSRAGVMREVTQIICGQADPRASAGACSRAASTS